VIRTFASALAAVAALSAAAGTAGGTSPGHGPDGRIAFAHPVRGRHTTFALSIVNPDGSGLQRLTHPADGVLDDDPDFSADGTLIAFQRCAGRCTIYTVRPDGSGLRSVGRSCQRKPPGCEDRAAPAWSPDGRRIAFVRSWGRVRNGEIEHSALMVMNRNGRSVRIVHRLRAFSGDVERPDWSPDGGRLAFAVSGPANRRTARTLYIMRADGSGARRLTSPSMRAGDHPDFSPDGSRIVFGAGAEGSHDRGGEIYSIAAAGGTPVRLTGSGRHGLVSPGSYSPDGSAITFARLRPGEDFLTSLYVMASDGTGAREIVPFVSAEHPDWGPLVP
jgi:TolB protein